MTGTMDANELELLRRSCSDLFNRYQDEQDGRAGWDDRLWQAIEQSGFALVSVPVEHGGEGGTLREAATVLTVAGEHCVMAPIGETAVLGAWLLGQAGLEIPAGPLTAVSAPPELQVNPVGGGWSVLGRLPRVPWGRYVARVAVLAGDHVLSLAPEAVSVEPGANLAGEPRDTLLVDCIVDRAEQARVQPGTDELLRRRQVLVRIALMAGAAQRALSSTLRYVSEREQFGRPLSGFQAVQQQVAELAGETAAMRISVDAAIDLCGRHGLEHDRAGDVLAAAKVQAGRGAGRVARIAHQLHGAIGLTDEHSLGLATTRLWAWRDEAGSEAEWACELGARVLDRGAEGLWCFITG